MSVPPAGRMARQAPDSARGLEPAWGERAESVKAIRHLQLPETYHTRVGIGAHDNVTY